jgi:hypothetical protein
MVARSVRWRGSAVRPPADLGDGGVALGGRRARVGGAGPLDEQPRRLVGGQRRHQPGRLPGRAQRLAARGEHREPGAGAQQRVRDLRARRDEVLAVVEHEQHAPRADGAGRPGEGRLAVALGHGQRGRHLMGEERRVAQGGQVGPGDALGRAARRAGRASGRLARQPRLAAAAGAGERHEPRRAQQARELVDLPAASDEGGEVGRQRAEDGRGGRRIGAGHPEVSRLGRGGGRRPGRAHDRARRRSHQPSAPAVPLPRIAPGRTFAPPARSPQRGRCP